MIRLDSIGRAALRAVGVGLLLGALAPAPALASVCGGLAGIRKDAPPPFRIGEELAFRLTFGGAYVGHFESKVGQVREVEGRRVLPLFGRARTSMFVSSFEPMTGRYMAMVDPATLEPIGLQTELEYGGDDRWEKVRFVDDGKAVQADFRVRGKEQSRRYRADHDLTDILTLLYLARTVELKPGLHVCQDVFSARRLWRMTASVLGVKDISTVAGRKRAFHVRLHFLRKPTPGLRRKNPPQYDVEVYLSADRYQTPLAFHLDLKGTRASGELERWTLGG
jgi:hypothetical protein